MAPDEAGFSLLYGSRETAGVLGDRRILCARSGGRLGVLAHLDASWLHRARSCSSPAAAECSGVGCNEKDASSARRE